MKYPGNPSLSPEVQDRLRETFQQTLDLASSGKRQEALLGCDFILRMDPQFEPARILLERLNSGGPAPSHEDVWATQRLSTGGVAAAAAAAEQDAGGGAAALGSPEEISFLSDSLEGIDPMFGSDEDAPSLVKPPPDMVAPPPAAGPGLREQIAAFVAQRKFREAVDLAERERGAVLRDPELRRQVDGARSLLEAEPYIAMFLESARQAIQAGETGQVERMIGKAKALDPSHPGILELEQTRGFYDDPERRMGARRRGIEMADGETGLLSAPSAVAPPRPPPPTAVAPPASMRPPSRPEPEDDLSFELGDPDSPMLSPPSASMAPPPLSFPGSPFSEPAPPPPPGPPTFQQSTSLGPLGSSTPLFEEKVSLPSESDRRIQELLDEGQAAFEAGNYQDAIDAWSRIFLIDIDHGEAARRIDMARKGKAELDRKVEEAFHDAMNQLETGEYDGAAEAFRKVLALQPSHLAAREYLQQIESGSPPPPVVRQAPEPRPAPRPAAVASAPSKRASRDDYLKPEIMVPPEPDSGERARARAAEPEVVAGRAKPSRKFLVIGLPVLLVVLLGGAFLWMQKDKLFPNSKPVPPPQVVEDDPIDRATKLHESGKSAIAVAQLRRLPPSHPRSTEAQALITRWEKELAAAQVPVVSEEDILRQEELVGAARGAYEQREYLRAAQLFEQAVAIQQLDPTAAEVYADAQRQLEPLAKQIQLIKEGELEMALPELWKRRDADPANKDVTRLIIDAYHNLAIKDLQRGDPVKALEKLKEALVLTPNDPELERHRRFAETYQERPQDLLYRTYVKYLAMR